jgi:hypothetical protein
MIPTSRAILQKKPKFSAFVPMDIFFKLEGNAEKYPKEQQHINCQPICTLRDVFIKYFTEIIGI